MVIMSLYLDGPYNILQPGLRDAAASHVSVHHHQQMYDRLHKEKCNAINIQNNIPNGDRLSICCCYINRLWGNIQIDYHLLCICLHHIDRCVEPACRTTKYSSICCSFLSFFIQPDQFPLCTHDIHSATQTNKQTSKQTNNKQTTDIQTNKQAHIGSRHETGSFVNVVTLSLSSCCLVYNILGESR